MRLKNLNRLVKGHLNINSLPRTLTQLKLIINNKVDMLVITETKSDSSFADSLFIIDGFRQPCRRDRNKHGGDVMILFKEDILSKLPSEHTFPDDTEGMFIEINWLMLQT